MPHNLLFLAKIKTGALISGLFCRRQVDNIKAKLPAESAPITGGANNIVPVGKSLKKPANGETSIVAKVSKRFFWSGPKDTDGTSDDSGNNNTK